MKEWHHSLARIARKAVLTLRESERYQRALTAMAEREGTNGVDVFGIISPACVLLFIARSV
jgi:hypothetical protein